MRTQRYIRLIVWFIGPDSPSRHFSLLALHKPLPERVQSRILVVAAVLLVDIAVRAPTKPLLAIVQPSFNLPTAEKPAIHLLQ